MPKLVKGIDDHIYTGELGQKKDTIRDHLLQAGTPIVVDYLEDAYDEGMWSRLSRFGIEEKARMSLWIKKGGF